MSPVNNLRRPDAAPPVDKSINDIILSYISRINREKAPNYFDDILRNLSPLAEEPINHQSIELQEDIGRAEVFLRAGFFPFLVFCCIREQKRRKEIGLDRRTLEELSIIAQKISGIKSDNLSSLSQRLLWAAKQGGERRRRLTKFGTNFPDNILLNPPSKRPRVEEIPNSTEPRPTSPSYAMVTSGDNAIDPSQRQAITHSVSGCVMITPEADQLDSGNPQNLQTAPGSTIGQHASLQHPATNTIEDRSLEGPSRYRLIVTPTYLCNVFPPEKVEYIAIRGGKACFMPYFPEVAAKCCFYLDVEPGLGIRAASELFGVIIENRNDQLFETRANGVKSRIEARLRLKGMRADRVAGFFGNHIDLAFSSSQPRTSEINLGHGRGLTYCVRLEIPSAISTPFRFKVKTSAAHLTTITNMLYGNF
ncbi:hypothetical protein BX600DRAFT_500715 [Xylariales sp. PMI_506]|nr:hypothetical protein BX600DRAFT_500715 [Xylariales sp. PMI_506]